MRWINLAGTSISSGLMEVYKAMNGKECAKMCVASPQNMKTVGHPMKQKVIKGNIFL